MTTCSVPLRCFASGAVIAGAFSSSRSSVARRSRPFASRWPKRSAAACCATWRFPWTWTRNRWGLWDATLVPGDGRSRTRLEVVSDEPTQTPVEELDEEQPIEAEAPEGLDAEAIERREEALAQVVKFGDPVLKSAASPVTDFDEGLAVEADR